LDALGAEIIPNPTKVGDFLRPFDEPDIIDLMESANRTRKEVWTKQPKAFCKEAILNVEGTIAVTTGECK